jgi:hypothetical protein
MSQLAIETGSYGTLPTASRLGAGEGLAATQLVSRIDESLESYAKNRSWTLGVVFANLLLLLIRALSPSGAAADERFWARN